MKKEYINLLKMYHTVQAKDIISFHIVVCLFKCKANILLYMYWRYTDEIMKSVLLVQYSKIY